MTQEEKLQMLYRNIESAKQIQVELLNDGDEYTESERVFIVSIWNGLDEIAKNTFDLLNSAGVKIPDCKTINF